MDFFDDPSPMMRNFEPTPPAKNSNKSKSIATSLSKSIKEKPTEQNKGGKNVRDIISMIRSDPKLRNAGTVRNRRNRATNKDQETRIPGVDILSRKTKAEEKQEMLNQTMKVVGEFENLFSQEFSTFGS